MEEAVRMIKKLINQVSGIEEVDIDETENLFSIGLDSIMLVEIEDELENYYNIEVPIDRITDDLDTIEKMAQYIMQERESNC